MAKVTDRQRLHRGCDLLAALRHPQIWSLLKDLGLTESEYEEGARLHRRAIELRFAAADGPQKLPGFNRLDAWENKWFPLADRALLRRHPAVHKKLFLNLGRTSGPELLLSLPIFLDRLAALENSKVAVEREAHAMLARRGLNAEAVGDARALIAEYQRHPGPLPVLADPQISARALEEFWLWYLDWSGVARREVSDPRLRRALGLSR